MEDAGADALTLINTLLGMRIDIALVDVAPLGVDTPEDLRRAREMLAPKGST